MTRAALAALLVPLALLGVACGDVAGDGAQGLSQVTPDASLSASDLCRAVSAPCADEGASECTTAGLRRCVESAGCLHWSTATPCPAGTACDRGACVAACPGQPCTEPGARRCDPDDPHAVLTCGDRDGDGCLDFDAVSACPDAGFCNAGGVCGPTCADACQDGARKCEGDAVVTCRESQDDGCLRWSAPEPCDDACATGACVAACEDECGAPGLLGCDGDGVRACALAGSGCLRWGTTSACPHGSTCSAGACSTSCVDECPAEGAQACDGGGRVVCGQRDADPCLEWSLPEPCASGTTCSDGACAASCADECTASGARACDPSGRAVRECGQHDADPCLEWQTVAQCSASESCSAGECRATCVAECVAGERRCRPGSTLKVELCGQFDADPCPEWGPADDCGGGQVCQGGQCVASCQDDCQAAACVDGAAVACGQFDADPCKDYGTPAPCGAGQVCEAGACHAAPPPPGRRISELLVNSVGEDTDVFIEVHGPTGASLAGFSLVAVNGADGLVYATIPLTGAFNQAGYYVVAHPSAAPWIAAAADQLDALADLQNGPDNLELRFGEVTVDAVAYGLFGPHDTFRGEGAPHPGVVPGHSIARDEAVTDTDDNARDFHDIAEPTPGRAAGGSVRPSADGDLLITEFMADPDVLSDSQGEWFELYNPSDTQRYRLDGCVLTDAGADAHVIDALLEVPPHGWITLARSAEPGFTPTYVYASYVLNNGGDAIRLECDGVVIASIAYTGVAPPWVAMARDPATFGLETSSSEAWCRATASYNGDLGTPNAANGSCHVGGTYDETIATWGAGYCPDLGTWREFEFEEAPAPLGDGALDLSWITVVCGAGNTAASLEVELRTGATWTSILSVSAGATEESCKWLAEDTTIPAEVLAQAHGAEGVVRGRFRATTGCDVWSRCGSVFGGAPTGCVRELRLTYPW